MTPGRGDAVEQSRETRTRRARPPQAERIAAAPRAGAGDRPRPLPGGRGGCSPGSPLVRASLRRRQKEGDGGRECLQWRPLSGVSAPVPGARCPPSAEQWRLRPRSTQREATGGAGRGSRGLQWEGRRCHVGAGEAGRGGSRWRERAAEAVGGDVFRRLPEARRALGTGDSGPEVGRGSLEEAMAGGQELGDVAL